jgi:phage shock protein C
MTNTSWQVSWDRMRRLGNSLYKDRENGLILGVCAGLADRFEWNPTAVRAVALIALFCVFVPTAIAYAAAGLVLPNRRLDFRGPGDEDRFWTGRDRAV